ncbi:hypothetical protein NX059_006444 [Plenodomus lindquistii]|nr:hypothetical protein NX059_006444 [Plenodomus lindquistii]
MPFRSPGAVSEMSGTTAISSFSMVEAEFLEPKFILKHLRKLCESTEEFLHHLAPYGVDMREDLDNIRELQRPESDFNEEYRDFDAELNVHLRHYKNEEHTYIHIRALHRALFGPNRDVVAAQSGLDLVLYLTNLLVFVKQTIYSDRSSKATWDALRQLDNSFPSHFMRSLFEDANPNPAGESGLLEDTFQLALELRTQLVIMVISRQGAGRNSNEIVEEVFMRSETSQAADGSALRGWSIPALGGDDASLPLEFEAQVLKRLEEIMGHIGSGNKPLEEQIAFLEEQFPWEPVILRLLHWVRLRHQELTTAIEELGGAAAIVQNIKQAIAELESAGDDAEILHAAPNLPRKKRKSFGRDRRRSGRKFNPNEPVDPATIAALKERERISGADIENMEQIEENVIQPTVEDEQDDLSIIRPERDDWQPMPEEQQIEKVEEGVVDPFADGNDNETLIAGAQHEFPQEPEPALQPVEEVEDDVEGSIANGPPASSAALLKLLKKVSVPQKENRPGRSIFDRHDDAQRVDFGDGFGDSQPTPGPSNTNKGKQPTQQSPQKRRRPVESEEDSEEDAYETHKRGSRVEKQRQKLPASKRVRLDPASSGAPPSHQPSRSTQDDEYIPPRRTQHHEESLSDEDAPSMTAVPPPSTYEAQRRLAQQNRMLQPSSRQRKPREAWSNAEEEALMYYMARLPGQYSKILTHDLAERCLLQERTQVNLKDKARNMAINMIKSGTGLRPGFEDLIKSTNKHGRDLIEQGYRW